MPVSLCCDPAAVLENVPGLIVTQHSGEGKANQYFLRAFNLDHGTDLAVEVDDMPVNMPSHAHGQGYADLNFLIPELVGDLRYKKGPTTPTKAISRPPARLASISRSGPASVAWATARMAIGVRCSSARPRLRRHVARRRRDLSQRRPV